MFSAQRSSTEDSVGSDRAGTARLLATGLALSIDNLVVGFALGIYQVSLAVAAVLIAAVCVAMSSIGPLAPRPQRHLGQ